MYRIPILKTKRGLTFGEAYYNYFLQAFRDEITKKLKWYEKRTFAKTMKGRKNSSVKVNIAPGSKAEEFLNKCLIDDKLMRNLLYGDLGQQIQEVDKIRAWVNDDNEFFPLTEVMFDAVKQSQDQGAPAVSHFNTVIRKVFVGTLYESVLQKEWIVNHLKLGVCPYCGTEEIYSTMFIHHINGKTVIKPELDHFLPKSVFPFFAVNVYNLIPCGDVCNGFLLKGDMNPVVVDQQNKYHLLLQHPYGYDDSWIHFGYVPSTATSPMEISVWYSDAYLEEGYNEYLGIKERYQHYIPQVEDMQERMEEELNDTAMDYSQSAFGVPRSFKRKNVVMVLGFNPTIRKPRTTLRHKFLSEIFLQMCQQYNITI